jgi:hypothetical protein
MGCAACQWRLTWCESQRQALVQRCLDGSRAGAHSTQHVQYVPNHGHVEYAIGHDGARAVEHILVEPAHVRKRIRECELSLLMACVETIITCVESKLVPVSVSVGSVML